MSVASLVLGLIGICFSFIPIFNYLIVIPVIVGLVLGIVDVAKKSKNKEQKKEMGITGIVLNSISLFIIIVWSFILLIIGAVASSVDSTSTKSIQRYNSYNYTSTPSYKYDYDYDYEDCLDDIDYFNL